MTLKFFFLPDDKKNIKTSMYGIEIFTKDSQRDFFIIIILKKNISIYFNRYNQKLP